MKTPNLSLDLLRNPVLLLAAAIALGLAVTTYQGIAAWSVLNAKPAAGTVAGGPVVHAAEKFSIDSLLNANLFGQADSSSRSDVPVPETTQALVLRGAFASGKPESAGALIEGSDGKTNWYRVGSSLPGGAILDEVNADHVLIKLGGRQESLRFPRVSQFESPGLASAGSLGISAVAAGDTRRVDEPIADLPEEEKAQAVRARLEELRKRSRKK